MNVLVYDGPGTSQLSVSGCLSSLTSLLSPYYSVRRLSPVALLTEPWAATTALLVLPGGRDVPYEDSLSGVGTRKIEEYVRLGGRYLGLCAGAYFASTNVEFEIGTPIAVQGSRDLKFWNGLCRGCAFPGFVYDSEAGARIAKIRLAKTPSSDSLDVQFREAMSLKGTVEAEPEDLEIYWNGGGLFVDAATSSSNATVFADYVEPLAVTGGSAAIISRAYGRGRILLSAVHPEISTSSLPNTSGALYTSFPAQNIVPSMKTAPEDTTTQDITEITDLNVSHVDTQRELVKEKQTKMRFGLLRSMLLDLGLKTNEDFTAAPVLSTLHLVTYSLPHRAVLLNVLKAQTQRLSDTNVIKGDTNVFRIISDPEQRSLPSPDGTRVVDEKPLEEQDVYISTHRHPPLFPLFDFGRYFATLHRMCYALQPISKVYKDPILGTILFYGETVTSSQSLLDKNFSLQRNLPDGFTILCSHQVSGRGRGQNAWISPPGVLSFSTILHHTPRPSDAPASIIFIQYLVSLAEVASIEALRPDLHPRIKWPNDIYLKLPTDRTDRDPISIPGTFSLSGERYAKVSGSLITTSYWQGKYIMTIGVGINVNNPHPTVSLNSVVGDDKSSKIEMEHLLASFMVNFADYHGRFVEAGSSFEIFQEEYYRKWVHQDQSVTIEASGERGKIVGIDTRNGTLRVNLGRETVGLQADGNSFDMLKGLIRVKS